MAEYKLLKDCLKFNLKTCVYETVKAGTIFIDPNKNNDCYDKTESFYFPLSIILKFTEWFEKIEWRPAHTEKYYTILFAGDDLITERFWTNNLVDYRLLKRKLVFKTREEALEAANFMLNKWEEKNK